MSTLTPAQFAATITRSIRATKQRTPCGSTAPRKPRPRKPIVLPLDVIIDTREQAPYPFTELPDSADGRPQRVRSTTRGTLQTGDYSLANLQKYFTLERKSLADLYSTLGQDRDRFKREFERMAVMHYAAVVIEATPEQLQSPGSFFPDWRSQLHPHSVMGTIEAWEIQFPNVHWILAGDRRGGELWAVEAMKRFAEFWEKKGHETT